MDAEFFKQHSTERLRSALADSIAAYSLLDLDSDPQDYADAVNEMNAIQRELKRREQAAPAR